MLQEYDIIHDFGMAIVKFNFSNYKTEVYRDIKAAAERSSSGYNTLRSMAKRDKMFFSKDDDCIYFSDVKIIPSTRGGERDNNKL